MHTFVLQFPTDGLIGSFAQMATIVASLLLVLMLVALGTYAYKHLRGDGVEWPDEKESTGPTDGVTKGDSDDEWDYY